MSYAVEIKQDYTVISLSGSYTDVSLGQVLNELVEHRDWKTYRAVLWDISRLDADSFDYKQLESAAHFSAAASSFRTHVKVAIFAPTDVHYGIAHMYVNVASTIAPRMRRVFRERDEAVTWLTGDIDP